MNWLNCFHFLILEGGLLIILIDCIIFLSPFLDVTRTSMSTHSLNLLLLKVGGEGGGEGGLTLAKIPRKGGGGCGKIAKG